MTWHARLALDYTVEAERTVLRFAHSGPLRILQSLYPEGPASATTCWCTRPAAWWAATRWKCTPGGPGAHGLLTTPGATRFYRSAGARGPAAHAACPGRRRPAGMAAAGGLCYSAARPKTTSPCNWRPAPPASAGTSPPWACPTPACRLPGGSCCSTSELPGLWLERGPSTPPIRACLTARWAWPATAAWHPGVLRHRHRAGSRPGASSALDAAREVLDAHPLAATAGATSPHGRKWSSCGRWRTW
jgi:urease accessory protein